jgi:hypothetical protein
MRSCYVAAVEAASIKVHLTWAPWRPTKAPEIQVARYAISQAGAIKYRMVPYMHVTFWN